MQAFSQRRGTEVDEQADASVRQFEVRQELLAVHRCESLDGLEFHQDPVLDDQIHAEPVLEHLPQVLKSNRLLSLDSKAALFECVRQECLVHGFEQAGTEILMESNRGIHDRPRDVIQLVHCSSPPRLRVSRRFTMPVYDWYHCGREAWCGGVTPASRQGQATCVRRPA